MHQYGLTFGFREPYQVLLDAEIVQDAARFKMDLIGGLERTLQGKVKPMVTQCSMRHLYATKDQTLITQAQKYERRRCNHHELEEPLSTIACLGEVVDPKDSRTNKHRYVVASQDAEVRARLRRIPGVPLVYISRSVMILEPMATATEGVRARAEKEKFRLGLKGARGGQVLGKRTREHEDDDVRQRTDDPTAVDLAPSAATGKKTKKQKQPNPLSVMKPKKDMQQPRIPPAGSSEDSDKRKRRRKRKAASGTENQEPTPAG